MKLAAGKPCPMCNREVTQKIIDDKPKLRRLKLQATFAKRKRNGELVGRPMKRDDDLIRRLKKQKYSNREIAKKTGMSIATVWRSLVDFRKGGG